MKGNWGGGIEGDWGVAYRLGRDCCRLGSPWRV